MINAAIINPPVRWHEEEATWLEIVWYINIIFLWSGEGDDMIGEGGGMWKMVFTC